MSKKLLLALWAAASLSLWAWDKAISQDGVWSTQKSLADNMSSSTDITKTQEKVYKSRYVPTTEAFLRTIAKANGEDFADLPIFTYDSLVKGVGHIDAHGFMCYGYKDKKDNIYYRYDPHYLAKFYEQLRTRQDISNQDLENPIKEQVDTIQDISNQNLENPIKEQVDTIPADPDFDNTEVQKSFESLSLDKRFMDIHFKIPYIIDPSGSEVVIVSEKRWWMLCTYDHIDPKKEVLFPYGSELYFFALYVDHYIDKRNVLRFFNSMGLFGSITKLKKEHVEYLKKLIFEDLPAFVKSSPVYKPPVYQKELDHEERERNSKSGREVKIDDVAPVGSPPTSTNVKIDVNDLDKLIDE